jgi:hypothetical protein
MVENRDNSIEFSDETIRRFLLGRLTAPEQLAFERKFFSDPRMDRRVRLAELDLADDYVYRRISADEHDLFEERFLLSAGRRRMVAVSIGLRDRFASASVVVAKSNFIARLRTLGFLRRPSWRLAFGLAILLLLFGAAWLVTKEPRMVERITNKIIPRRSSPRSVPQEVHHPVNTSGPEHQITPAPMPPHDQTPSPSVSIALLPVISADGVNMPSFSLPKGEDAIVRLQLALTPNQPGTYRVELLTVEGQTVFSAESIMAPESGSAQIDFDVPTRLLKSGNYQIRLARDNPGMEENPGRYYFRVR